MGNVATNVPYFRIRIFGSVFHKYYWGISWRIQRGLDSDDGKISSISIDEDIFKFRKENTSHIKKFHSISKAA